MTAHTAVASIAAHRRNSDPLARRNLPMSAGAISKVKSGDLRRIDSSGTNRFKKDDAEPASWMMGWNRNSGDPSGRNSSMGRKSSMASPTGRISSMASSLDAGGTQTGGGPVKGITRFSLQSANDYQDFGIGGDDSDKAALSKIAQAQTRIESQLAKLTAKLSQQDVSCLMGEVLTDVKSLCSAFLPPDSSPSAGPPPPRFLSRDSVHVGPVERPTLITHQGFASSMESIPFGRSPSVPFAESDTLTSTGMPVDMQSADRTTVEKSIRMCGSITSVLEEEGAETHGPDSERSSNYVSGSSNVVIAPFPNAKTILSGAQSPQGSAQSVSCTPMQWGQSQTLSWPGTIHMRQELQSMQSPDATRQDNLEQVSKAVRANLARALHISNTINLGGTVLENGVVEEITRIRRRCSQSWVISPIAFKMMAYNLLSSLVLLVDLYIFPYALAWDLDFEGAYWTYAWCSFFFWVSDVGISLVTGYFSDEQIEMRWRLVVKHYLRTWFWLDVPLVFLDGVSMIASVFVVGKFVRVGKVLRCLRVISLLRAWRVSQSIVNTLERDLSDSWRAFTYISKIVILIMWLGHVICCMWYWIGANAHTGTGYRWFDTLDIDDKTKFLDLNGTYQYLTAFHWALSQVSGNSVELITPMNSWERIFNICICIFQVLFGTFLVSTLAATMIEVQMSKHEKLSKIRTARQFLAQNSIESQLAIRVQKQLQERIGQPKRLSFDDVPGLAVLSKKIRMELQFAIVGPYLLRHPLYNLCAEIDATAVQCFCFEAVEVMVCPPNEVIFVHGTPAEDCLLVIAGQLQYTQTPVSCAYVEHAISVLVTEGAWVSRAALWSCWTHVGTLEATSGTCELLNINALGVLDVMLKHPIMGDILREYGGQFHARLVSASPPRADYPTDIEVPFTSYKEMVLAMKKDVRIIIGMVALSRLRKSQSWFQHSQLALQKLEREVLSGKSTVMMTEDGDIERVVALSALHLELQDGRLLAQVGRYTDGVLVHKCQWPGGSLQEGELPCEALERLIDDELEPFKPALLWRGDRHPDQEVDNRMSSTYAITTEYIKTFHYAFFSLEADLIPEGARPMKTQGWTSQPGPRHGGSQTAQSAPDLSAVSVFIFQTKENATDNVFAWLLPEDFEFLRHPESSVVVQHWLDSLKVVETAWAEEPSQEQSMVASTLCSGDSPMLDKTPWAIHPFSTVPFEPRGEAPILETFAEDLG